jgi:tellurite resistance protein
MGLEKFAESDGMMEGERKVLRRANAVLGF